MYVRGSDWWLDQYAEVQLTEDRWIKAMEIKPSNRKIVHHAVVYAIEPNAPEGAPPEGTTLTEYAIGKYGDIFADNTSRLLKKVTRLRFDMHYFAIGSEQKNRTTIGFKFYPKGFVPKYEGRNLSIRNIPNDELEIPPNTSGPDRWIFPSSQERADRLIPAPYAHARQGNDARSHQPQQHFRNP